MVRLPRINPSVLALSLLASVTFPGTSLAQDARVSATATLNRDDLRRAFVSGLPEPGTREADERARQQAPTQDWASEGRACEGCPKRRVWAAYVQTGIINVIYNLGNKARGEETATVGLNSWWNNLKYGFEWDDNPFTTNQFGHPYQGSNYYTGARANGMSYWESAAVAAFGSATWEYFGENNYASFNDLVNTTLGGIALGETFHRLAWMMRDTTASGKKRLWQEIGATVVDPVGGANRFISGDASRVSEKPKQFVPSASNATSYFGVLWQGDNQNAFSGTADAFLEMDLTYGRPLQGRTREPFEAFAVNLRLGGGKAISDVRVRGRLLGQPLNEDGRVHLMVAQSYDYVSNKAYEFGRQGFDVAFSTRQPLGSGIETVLIGGLGVTALGAIDQVTRPATLEEDLEGEDDRTYDYGPGTTFAGSALFTRNGLQFASISYQGYQIYVVDGIRSNHVLQRFRLDLLVPVYRRLAVGATGEFFYRKTYFPDGAETRDKFPQVRFYVAWR